MLRCRRTEWTGDEPIPSWVFDCISRRDIPNRTQISFWLKPHEGSDLPPIGRRRFNTTRALKLYKVAAYIAKNLEVEMPFVQLPTPAISGNFLSCVYPSSMAYCYSTYNFNLKTVKSSQIMHRECVPRNILFFRVKERCAA